MAKRIITVAKVHDLISISREVGYAVTLFWDPAPSADPHSIVRLSTSIGTELILTTSMLHKDFEQWRSSNPDGVQLIEGRVEFAE